MLADETSAPSVVADEVLTITLRFAAETSAPSVVALENDTPVLAAGFSIRLEDLNSCQGLARINSSSATGRQASLG